MPGRLRPTAISRMRRWGRKRAVRRTRARRSSRSRVVFSRTSGTKAEATTARSKRFHGSRKNAFGRSAQAPTRSSISRVNRARQQFSAPCSTSRYSAASPLYVSTPISAALKRIAQKTTIPKAGASVATRHRAASFIRPRPAGLGSVIVLLVLSSAPRAKRRATPLTPQARSGFTSLRPPVHAGVSGSTVPLTRARLRPLAPARGQVRCVNSRLICGWGDPSAHMLASYTRTAYVRTPCIRASACLAAVRGPRRECPYPTLLPGRRERRAR